VGQWTGGYDRLNRSLLRSWAWVVGGQTINRSPLRGWARRRGRTSCNHLLGVRLLTIGGVTHRVLLESWQEG
jgi:hypothetical protein